MNILAHQLAPAYQRAVIGFSDIAPETFLSLLRLRYSRKPFRRKIVSPTTELTVEGYPRSGNSFARKAFMLGRPEGLQIATHTHSAAQVRSSVRLGLPTMVVFREPGPAITSLLALRLQTRGRGSALATARMAAAEFRRYALFYDQVLELGDAVCLVDFDSLTQDFGAEMQRFNQMFGTEFPIFEHTDESESEVFRTSRLHLSPNDEREALKITAGQIVSDVPRLAHEAANISYCSIKKAASAQETPAQDPRRHNG